jgi:hypothetical protein
MTGWESTQKCLVDLYRDFKNVHAASKKDDEVDADGDGVADVLQVSPTDLLTRKTLLFLKVCILSFVCHLLYLLLGCRCPIKSCPSVFRYVVTIPTLLIIITAIIKTTIHLTPLALALVFLSPSSDCRPSPLH